MANSIGILNEGFKKYESIKPSFEDELYEAMKSLTERQQEWSDEDKHDNEILWGIRNKKQKRANAKLTPEEQSVLDKYNISVHKLKGASKAKGELRDNEGHRVDFGDDVFSSKIDTPFGDREVPNRKINVPDRARKRPERVRNSDTSSDKLNDYNFNYNSMKSALNSRKNAESNLADLQNKLDGRLSDAKVSYKTLVDKAYYDYNADKEDYGRELNRSQNKINKLLKRESLSKKRMNESASDDYYDLAHNIAELAADIKKENPDMEISDCIFGAIDQQLIYDADQWVVLQEFANPLDLFTEEIWDDFYSDIYGKIDEYLDDEDLEESLKSKKIEK